MPRILIADDEALERKALRYIIEGADLGGEAAQVDEAENGAEAVRLAAQGAYDTIFLDIKMPGLDGLGAAERIRKEGCTAPIVILSAFDAFEYAQKAIRLGVYEYLLKPAGAEEVLEALRRSLAYDQEIDSLAKKKDKSLSIISETLDMLEGKILAQMESGALDDPSLEEYEGLAELAGQTRSYIGMQVVFRTSAESLAVARAAMDAALEKFKALGKKEGRTVLASPSGNAAWCLVYGIEASQAEALGAYVDAARKSIQDEMPASLKFGIAGPSNAPGSLLLERAREALQLASPERPVVRLVSWSGDGSEWGDGSAGQAGKGLGLRALDFLKKNYAKNLSLASAAEQLGVSPSHLSHVIPKDLGIGFNELLNRIRINKAKELMAGGASIKEASYLVGFSDQAYFTRVFKRMERALPRDFLEGIAKKYKSPPKIYKAADGEQA